MKHGERKTYIHQGCRCKACTEACRVYQRQLMLRLVETEPPEHGTWNGYTNYSCRCDLCKAAAVVVNRRRYER